MTTILTTARLALRTWTLDDAEAYLALYGDARVVRYAGRPPTPDLAAARKRVAQFIEHTNARGFGHWALIVGDGGALKGSCGFRPSEGDVLEIGFAIDPSLWGAGYATEIASACLGHGFTKLGASRITGFTMPANLASRRVLEKVGLRFTREVVEDSVTWCVYEMRADEYQAQAMRMASSVGDAYAGRSDT